MGMLPGRDRRVVGIKAPSTNAKVKGWLNGARARFNGAGRAFLGKR